MTQNSHLLRSGIDVAKDRLEVVLRPSGRYVEATNDERGIRSVVRLLCVRRTWRWRCSKPPGGSCQPAAELALAGRPVANSSTPGSSGTYAPWPRASSPGRPTGSTPACSPTSPRRSGHRATPLGRGEHARELSAVVLRRRQILAMRTAEARAGRAPPRRPSGRGSRRTCAGLVGRRTGASRGGELERVVKGSLWCGRRGRTSS
jgi:transposase